MCGAALPLGCTEASSRRVARCARCHHIQRGRAQRLHRGSLHIAPDVLAARPSVLVKQASSHTAMIMLTLMQRQDLAPTIITDRDRQTESDRQTRIHIRPRIRIPRRCLHMFHPESCKADVLCNHLQRWVWCHHLQGGHQCMRRGCNHTQPCACRHQCTAAIVDPGFGL